MFGGRRGRRLDQPHHHQQGAARRRPCRVLAWPGYDEKPVVGEFEEANKVKVEFKNYIGGEQMLQYFAQVPKGSFDAIISDAEYIQKFVAQGVLDPLNPADLHQPRRLPPEIPGFPAAARARRQDVGHCDPLQLLRHLLQQEVRLRRGGRQLGRSLFEPKFKGKMVMFDWYLPNMSNASLAVFPNNERPYDISDAQLVRSRPG